MYRHQLKEYKKTGTDVIKKKEEWAAVLFSKEAFLVYGCAFLMGRTVIMDELSPFGIGFFAAVYMIFGNGLAILSSVAAAAGYMCAGSFTSGVVHSCVILMLAGLFSATKLREKQKPAAVLTGVFIVSFIAFFIFNFIMKQSYSTAYQITMAGIEAILATGLGYIFSYGVPLYFRIKKRKLLTREEWTCIIFMAAVLLGGFWDIETNGISIRRILAAFFTMAVAYMEGPSQGALTGVMVGLVLSLTGGEEMSYVGIYGISGLASGVFKRKNKLISSLVFIAGYIFITSYSKNGIYAEDIMELFAGWLAFLIIKKNWYEKAAFMMDGEEIGLEMQRQYSQRVQEIMGSRLSEIAATLTDLSEVLNETADKDIFRKSEVDGAVENIADKVCATCEGRNLCWKKEFYKTYDSFKMLMEYAEKKGRVSLKDMPQDLQRKCIKPNELIRQVNSVFEIFKLNSRWRRKIFNSKRIVAQQLESISHMVKGMASDVGISFEFKNDLEESICAALDKRGLEFNDVIAVKDRNGKYEVSVYRSPCMGKQSCLKEYAATISKTLGVKMVRDSIKCRLNSDCSLCQFRLIEAECYNIATAVAQRSVGEVCGDCYLYDNINKGRYMLAISDGMGSGRTAVMESGVTISLLEKFMNAGYERNSAIKAINSVLLLRSCEENYATIDLGIIDLYNGVGEFIKIGSASTFIKSGNEVRVLRSSSLPVGILDDIDVESEIINLDDGDIIVMVTDGVEDSMGLDNEKWLRDAIRSMDSGNPRDIADRIIHMAEENYKGEIMDDMTVLVSKIWKQYD